MKPLLVHCHMPKTAGSALNRSVLRPRFSSDATWMAYGVAVERDARLDLSAARSIEFVSGHIPFGCLDGSGRRTFYLSLLRDPVERFISFLNFAAVAERHGARRKLKGNPQALARRDPDAFAAEMLSHERIRLRHANAMVRLASGEARLTDAPLETIHLQQAMSNIRSGRYLIGLQEEFDAFVERLVAVCEDKRLGAEGRNESVDRSNVMEKRLTKIVCREALSRKTLARIEALNHLDRRLYDDVHGALSGASAGQQDFHTD